MIYLDNSATTQIDPKVVETMMPYLQQEFGNPSSKYYTLAQNAEKAVEQSRTQVAKLINCDSEEVIFTSGSSESNNFIIKGVCEYYGDTKKHLITSVAEHKSVLETFKYLESKGYEVTYLPVDSEGRVNIESLLSSLRQDTLLVSIMWANNELGTINPIKELAKVCKEKEVFFHTDATQAVGKIKVDLKESQADFLSLSGHKLHGPKGVGAAIIKKDELGLKRKITPLIHGGGQERDYRAGTLAVHNIVGLGTACHIAQEEFADYTEKVGELEELLKSNLAKIIPECIFNSPDQNKLPGIVNVNLPSLNNELLIRKLKDKVAISTGSACALKSPSYVLNSIGLNKEEIKNTLRITIGKFNTRYDIDVFVKELKEYKNKFAIL